MSSDKDKSLKKKSRCQVPNCTRNPNVSVHRLPKNDFSRRKWIKRLKLTEFSDPFYVCQLHFVEEDFSGAASRRFLRAWAVPSVNLPKTTENALQLSAAPSISLPKPSGNGLDLLSAEEGLMDEVVMMNSNDNDEVVVFKIYDIT